MVKVADESVDLRRGIDHIGITVCFIIHDGNGHILLHKRGAGARDENGRWDIGGGALEFGETIDSAVRREIKEEFCCTAKNIQFITAYEAFRKHQDSDTHWIALVHCVQVDPKEVRIGEPDKIEELGWFTSDTLPSPLHSQFEKSFNAVKHLGLIK
jgi:ADP-ribose pyrophosphatase YjhB (NUDIX family)